ncbi:MAG: exodeoxyribonuclease VII large subunit [Victivallaceae bacterium]|nr:exodeoxyribonuclease VII large subunit [Victivallaceae bacterium]
MTGTPTGEKIWTVSEVNRAVRDLVEGSFMPMWIAGEIGTIVLHNSGHVYLTLKDGRSQIRACWFGGAARGRELGLAPGMAIEGFGQLSVYEVRGEYQISLRTVRLAGVGDLQRRFEELKAKLSAEGLFSPERKKPIPLLPRTIGVVTSADGAALRDFLKVLASFGVKADVRIYPAPVQGAGASRFLARGVAFFNRSFPVDVIVVTRGGGSMEDLWEFNEEVLARAIAASQVPVLSAVGHEIDFTISDFVADRREPTPSAAAQFIGGNFAECTEKTARAIKDMHAALRAATDGAELRLRKVMSGVWRRDPVRLVSDRRQYLDELSARAERALSNWLRIQREKTARLAATLEALDVRRQLERGYAIVSDREGVPIRSAADAPAGKEISVRFFDGRKNAVVTE